MKKLVSKWFITKVFIGCGILSSFIILLIGFILGIMASNGLETIADSWVAFWAVFATYLYAALIILFSTAVFSVILVGICQAIDELRLIRSHLTGTPIVEIQVDKPEPAVVKLEKKDNNSNTNVYSDSFED